MELPRRHRLLGFIARVSDLGDPRGASELGFEVNSQEMLLLLLGGPHFEIC